MILTNDEQLARRAKHITTTAKIPHRWEFDHDEVGYNYRLTNVNAALGVAQMENISKYIQDKRELARLYREFFEKIGVIFFSEQPHCQANYWLNVLILKSRQERDAFLAFTNDHGIMTRPFWKLMKKLRMYERCCSTNLDNAEWLEDRAVHIPSSPRF